MIFSSNHLHAFAALALAAAGGFMPFGSAAVELVVSDCAGLADLIVDQMTEDVNLFLDDAVALTCDTVSRSPAASICVWLVLGVYSKAPSSTSASPSCGVAS